MHCRLYKHLTPQIANAIMFDNISTKVAGGGFVTESRAVAQPNFRTNQYRRLGTRTASYWTDLDHSIIR